MFQQTIARTDYLRRSPWPITGVAGHREWLHFCVFGPDIELLINFSVADDGRHAAARGAEVPRLIMLVRSGREWDGDVDVYSMEESEIHGGRIDARLGESRMRFEDGAFRIVAQLRGRDLAVDLTLRPMTRPSLAQSVALAPGSSINWVVVPRLSASGTIRHQGRLHRLSDAPAYHDHNWGQLAGLDFSWEWGIVVPEAPSAPWSAVFVRLSNRARTRVFMQALLLWKGARQHRVLRAEELTVNRKGLLRPRELVKVPRVMALVSPGSATDVPSHFSVEGEGDGDRLRCDFAADSQAQVIVPDDDDLAVTCINEVSGRARVQGVVRGEPVEMEGRALFEFLGS